MSQSKRITRHYDAEFKRRAVTLYHTSEKSYADLGKELGIPSATLSTWVYNAKQENSKASGNQNTDNAQNLSKELLQLKREMKILKEERDILKKALAIFSTDGPNQ